MVKPLLKVPSITIICKVMASPIPLMIENHYATRPKKINAKGELSFIGIYTQLKPTFLALLTRTILIIILKSRTQLGSGSGL
jgi:hypothetical protein